MDYYDLYCERLGPGLLAEPVNAVTNAAFFAAAWVGWRDARSGGWLDAQSRLLIALVVAIGIGSSLFHTFATGWARVLDELPILFFQLLYVWAYARRAMRLTAWAAAAIVLGYLAAAIYCRGYGQWLNGSLVYAPAVAITLVLGWRHCRGVTGVGRYALLAAAAILVVAVALRTLDASICEAFPLGTHFLWHILVASVAGLCLHALFTSTHEPDRA